LRSGRFHRATDRSSPVDSWPALYAALDLTTAIGEMVRARKPGDLRGVRFTEIEVDLSAVADCRDPDAVEIDVVRLFADWDFTLGQALAKQARADGAEALLVPSASDLGDNLIVFPDRLRSTSTLTVVRSVDPRLIKDAR